MRRDSRHDLQPMYRGNPKHQSYPTIVKYLSICFITILAALLAGCTTLAKREETGVVIARRAQVRSSMAVVAADLVEVSRGDQLDILDSDMADGERWLRVRAHDEENTEGWIEARNVMPEKVLESSRELAREDTDIPPQATGQLRASTNVRLSPDRSNNTNILMKLESGARFDIVGWKRVPKPKSSEATESDTAPKAGSVQQGPSKSVKESEEPREPEETNELWYKVRLPISISPAPGGWIYGKQVELTVPSDIIFYRTGREFMAWHRLDDDPEATAPDTGGKDSSKDIHPGSWVILEKSSSDEPHKLEEPDFDRIYVLGYDKHRQEHYTAYRGPDVKGFLPLRVEGRGNDKTFTVRIQDADGQVKDEQYRVYKDDRGILKVAAPNDAARGRKKR
jgi:hypothetical protein